MKMTDDVGSIEEAAPATGTPGEGSAGRAEGDATALPLSAPPARPDRDDDHQSDAPDRHRDRPAAASTGARPPDRAPELRLS